MCIITKTCDKTLKNKIYNDAANLPWWSEDLAKLKKEAGTYTSSIRCALPVRKAGVVKVYLEKKII